MTDKKKSHWGAWVVGLLLLAVGVAWILNNIGILDFPVYKWWPLVLIVFGVLYLVLRRRIFAPIGWFLIVLGLIFLLTAHDIVRWALIWKIWPVILVFFGLLIIIQRIIGDKASGFDYIDEEPEPVSDRFRGSSVFGGITKKVKSKAFKGGIIYTVFGGADLNFHSAGLDDKGAVLDLFSTFGGITIRLPKMWVIEVRPSTVFGGITNWTSNEEQTSGKRLIINATTTFGGITIIN